MSYRDALASLASSSQRGMRLGLETTRSLCAELGDPQGHLPGVLVAGTNGKGSVAAMVAAIAGAAGLRVALLTKPHLTSYRERIQLGGQPVSEATFTDLAERVLAAAQRMDRSSGRPTHHELLTAMGFQAALDWGAEVTICEVGLGGRLDATNVWDGGVAVVTSIGLDHQAQLGSTIPAIAKEKAAIIKMGDLAVSGVRGEAIPVVAAAAAAAGARLWQLGDEIQVVRHSTDGSYLIDVSTPQRSLRDLRLGVQGQFQAANAAVAVAATDCLSYLGFTFSDDQVRQGLADLRWPGRLQSLGGTPEITVDAAHNPDAVAAVLPDLRELVEGRPTTLLFGAMADHDHQTMLELLGHLPFAHAVVTQAHSLRAVPAPQLKGEWVGPALTCEPVAAALALARSLAGADGRVVVLGSIYVVGEVMAEMGIGLAPDPEVPGQPIW